MLTADQVAAMNPELLQRLAREAGMHIESAMRVDLRDGSSRPVGTAEVMRAPVDQLARFAALVAEQCAQIVELGPTREAAAHRARAAFPMPKD